ncbi:M20/M25/M40 family metallo-hydrolase [Salinirubellus salinus]|uniref:M20/M25/M40 family metallo-hydrolase n=1 Tax=Salinirubellus salinus TaxID=1364945 RepID=A0A9E7U9U6_9EURY|nr:M20/M25/M40 family metallo-hydrolase [Salinirubellus salinus]UWM53372.1 M20/M25/M40 family metallo-hydrolase [Salinirubellus salinus]
MSAGTSRAAADTVDTDRTVDLLRSLVRIESPYFHEAEIVEFVHDWLAERGLDPSYHRVSEPDVTGYEGRNVIARLEGSDPAAPTLLLNGHVDTVELVADWEEDPLSGRIEDGRLYGQGAADMKAGLAAAMSAFAALAEADVDLAGDVVLTAVVDEEGPYGLGTDQLIRDGRLADCDMAVVTEPGPAFDSESDATNPRLYLGARGRFLYDIEVRGTAAHGSMPERGANAVVAASRIAAALEEMEVGSHPLLGSGSVCPLRIEGGSQTLSVPESCRLLVDRHVVPGETSGTVLSEAEAVVDSLDLGDVDVDVGLRETPHPDARYGPYTVDEDEPLVEGLAAATETVTGDRPGVGYFPSVGDFNYLGHREGLPTVILGPDGANVHSAGEWVDVAETVEVARILAAGAVELVGTAQRADARHDGGEDAD